MRKVFRLEMCGCDFDLCTVCSPTCNVENKVTGSHDLSSEEEELVEVSDDCHENQWDCESILSTYSNLYNHPVTISDPVSQCRV